MSGNWGEVKERVREALDIVDVAGGYFDLRREGRNFTALCPWHNDSRPSLQFNPERQSYRCWVCKVGGDIFSLVMQMEGVEFPEALRQLAERAGISIQNNPSHRAASDEKKGLFEAAAWVEQQYHDCLLQAPQAEPARRYLNQRGIDPALWRHFHLGYAPDDWNWLQDRARRSGISLDALSTIGALVRRDGGTYYDRFKGRVLFSIRNAQGKPVALGGRILPGASEGEHRLAKYVNSPETPLFKKGDLLYAFDLARDSWIRQKTAVVVEGYTDVILAHRHGLTNVTAVLGTALGEAHLKLLRRFVQRVILLLDGDEAGRARTNEILKLFVAQQVDLRVLTLPDELDPADFLSRHGPAALQALFESAPDALEHKFREARGRLGLGQSTHVAEQAIEDVLATLAQAPGGSLTTGPEKIREARILTRLAHESAVAEDVLRQRLAQLRRARQDHPRQRGEERSDPFEPAPEPSSQTSRSWSRDGRSGRDEPPGRARHDGPAASEIAPNTGVSPRRENSTTAPQPWERQLLETLLQAAECEDCDDLLDEARHAVEPEQFASPACREIFALWRDVLEDAGAASFAELMLAADDPRLKNQLVELDEEGRRRRQGKSQAEIAQQLRDILEHLRWRENQQRQGREIARLKLNPADDEAGRQVLEQLIRQQRERQGISLPTEG